MSPDPEPCFEGARAPGLLANRAARVFNRRVDALLRPLGLMMSHLSPLMLLSERGPVLQRDLVRASGIAQPAMVHVLGKLEAAGFISRKPSDQDRRATIIKLTEKGSRAVRVASPILVQANERALAGFTPVESDILAVLLGRMIANLDAED